MREWDRSVYYRDETISAGYGGITVSYDKGKDNDFTLKSKLISAYRKTGTDLSQLNEDMQKLKKHKSVIVHY